MKESLYRYLIKCSVAELPPEKQLFYNFVQDVEYAYEEQADTPDQYFDLLVKRHPYVQAAEHFQLPVETARNLMIEIEQEIRNAADNRMQQVYWLDYTQQVSAIEHSNKQYFFIGI
ncbi:hypothetical protein B4U37_04050 [Sutcliffiella horikoshii]|uniref:Sigma-70 family RNA polymerase sigma factor n=1 Tax=Sutcliffiella horikoshii TaxID=79883 RepID=A0ABM6KFK0_9BACI|nr:hypothetical protein [Sutcliffiella horikoshii]ART75267.1 hypothetical protein B4U37_04050 [Sutcliffiella horikoshii]